MTQQGVILQSYNNELMKYLEELFLRKKDMDQQIRKLLDEMSEIQSEIDILTKQLENICESLLCKNVVQKKLDKILVEGIFGYDKILDCSKMLLNILKKEMEHYDKLFELRRLFSE